MTLDEILRGTMAVEERIERCAPGSPDLAAALSRLHELDGELTRTRGLQGALIPDAARPPTSDEQSAEGLSRTIRSLLAAAHSKQAP